MGDIFHGGESLMTNDCFHLVISSKNDSNNGGDAFIAQKFGPMQLSEQKL